MLWKKLNWRKRIGSIGRKSYSLLDRMARKCLPEQKSKLEVNKEVDPEDSSRGTHLQRSWNLNNLGKSEKY